MQSVDGSRFGGRKRLLFWIPSVALVLVVLQFIAINPISSVFGGFFYLLFGWWVLPSAVNVLLATWFAILFRTHWTLRVFIGLLFSFLLGVNTSLPTLLHLSRLSPADVTVVRAVPITRSVAVDTRAVVTNSGIQKDRVLAPPGVRLDASEGCGCMFWVATSPTYSNLIQQLIDGRGLSQVSSQYQFSDQLPNVSPYDKIVHFMIRFTPSTVQRDDLVDMEVDVYQGHDKVATYRQGKLPIEKGLISGDQKLRNSHFLANAWDTLLHQGIWTTLLRDHLQRNASVAPFAAFLNQVFPRVANGNPPTREVLAETPPAQNSVSDIPDVRDTVKTIKITMEKNSGVDWVTLGSNPFALPTGQACTPALRKAAAVRAKRQNLAAERESDGSFEALIVPFAPFELPQACQWILNLTVKFYSKGALVGDATVDEDLFRGSGVYGGICVSERVDYLGAKPGYVPLCFRKGLDSAVDQGREKKVRSFAWNHVFDARVELKQ